MLCLYVYGNVGHNFQQLERHIVSINLPHLQTALALATTFFYIVFTIRTCSALRAAGAAEAPAPQPRPRAPSTLERVSSLTCPGVARCYRVPCGHTCLLDSPALQHRATRRNDSRNTVHVNKHSGSIDGRARRTLPARSTSRSLANGQEGLAPPRAISAGIVSHFAGISVPGMSPLAFPR